MLGNQIFKLQGYFESKLININRLLKLHKVELTIIILSMLLNTLVDSSFDSMWNVFICLMTCSTSILTFAILLVLLASAGTIWGVPRLPGGIIKYKLLPAHSSNRLQLLSAITLQFMTTYPKALTTVWVFCHESIPRKPLKQRWYQSLVHHRLDISQYFGACILTMLHFVTPDLLVFLWRLHSRLLVKTPSLLGFGIDRNLIRWGYVNCYKNLYVKKRLQVMYHCP